LRVDANIKRDDASALAAMKKLGLTVNPMDPAEATRWRQIGAQVTHDMEVDKRVSTEALTAIRKAIAGAH
jgi:hypothetical protein